MSRDGNVLRLLRNKIIISYLIGVATISILYLIITTCAKILAPPILTTIYIILQILTIGLLVSSPIPVVYYILTLILVLKKQKRRIFSITSEEMNTLSLRNASRLFSRKSEEDTLIAILEWIHRNMRFWNERCYLVIWICITIITSIIPILLFSVAVIDNLALSIVLAIIAVLVSTSVYLQLLPYTRMYRQGFLKVFKLMLKPTLSISEILNLRLAVCRDYARFTAAILLNLYPENPVYIITIPRHAACAIELSEKIYVLDQRLPIMTLNGWRRYWCKRLGRCGSRATMEVYRLEKEVIGDKVYFVPKLVKKQRLCIDHSINIEQILNKLSMKLSNNFTMRRTAKKIREEQVNYYEQDIEILKYIEVLDDDDLVIESLCKLILLRLENELLDKINSIIELKPHVCNNNALCVKAIVAL